MNKLQKIKESYIFRRAYKKGRSMVSPYVVVYAVKNRYNDIRLGITVGKKIGNAVSRNRAKRVITAAFRAVLPQIPVGYDYVVVARNRILTVKSTVVAESLLKLFRSADIKDNSNSNE